MHINSCNLHIHLLKPVLGSSLDWRQNLRDTGTRLNNFLMARWEVAELEFKYRLKDADSFSENVDWLHSCTHFICKPSLSLFPFLPLSAFRRGGAVYNSTKQFLWINQLTGCCFQTQSSTQNTSVCFSCVFSDWVSLRSFIWVFIWLLAHSRNHLLSPTKCQAGTGCMWVPGSCLKQEFLTWGLRMGVRGSLEFL